MCVCTTSRAKTTLAATTVPWFFAYASDMLFAVSQYVTCLYYLITVISLIYNKNIFLLENFSIEESSYLISTSYSE